MTIQEALELATKSLENEAEQFKCDERSLEIFGELAGIGIQRNVKRRKRLLEAASALKNYRREVDKWEKD